MFQHQAGRHAAQLLGGSACGLSPRAASHGTSTHYCRISSCDTKWPGGLWSHLPYICWTILYQTCKPSGMLRALNFYEILGSVIVRQTQGLVTNSPPFTDAKASPRDAWSPRGRPSSGAVEIDEDSRHPGEINALELRGQDCGALRVGAGKGAQPRGACCPSSLNLASGGGVGGGTQHPPSAQLGSHLVSGKDRCLSPGGRHHVTQGPDSVT